MWIGSNEKKKSFGGLLVLSILNLPMLSLVKQTPNSIDMLCARHPELVIIWLIGLNYNINIKGDLFIKCGVKLPFLEAMDGGRFLIGRDLSLSLPCSCITYWFSPDVNPLFQSLENTRDNHSAWAWLAKEKTSYILLDLTLFLLACLSWWKPLTNLLLTSLQQPDYVQGPVPEYHFPNHDASEEE